MNEEKLRSLWGDDLFNYAYAKSVELVGAPIYSVMLMAALGKMKDQLKLTISIL